MTFPQPLLMNFTCSDSCRKLVRSQLAASHAWLPRMIVLTPSAFFLADVSNIFYFFLLGAGGGGSPRRQEWAGVGFLLKIPGGGGGGSPTRGGGRGAGRVSVGNFWEGAKYFFSGPKCPPSFYIGTRKSTQTFSGKTFREPFGPWTSAPRIVDIRTKKCVFLWPR